MFLISTVSFIFPGHLGTVEGNAVTLGVLVVNAVGNVAETELTLACDTLISQSFVDKNVKCMGIILQRGTLILMSCGLPFWATLFNTEDILQLLKPWNLQDSPGLCGFSFLLFQQHSCSAADKIYMK